MRGFVIRRQSSGKGDNIRIICITARVSNHVNLVGGVIATILRFTVTKTHSRSDLGQTKIGEQLK